MSLPASRPRRSRRRRTEYRRWSQEEAAFLAELVGEQPLACVAVAYRREARRRGWPLRTVQAIENRARRQGQRVGCRVAEWLTTGGAAELLGVPLTRISYWIGVPAKAEALQPKRVGGNWFISRAGFRRLARRMPETFGGIDRGRLLALLEDVELATDLAARYPLRPSDYRIRCVETGRVWRSCAAAGRHYHVSARAMAQAIQERRPVQSIGLSFVAVRDEKAQPCQA